MPQSKNLGSFPTEFFEIFEKAIDNPMGIRQPSEEEAQKTRMSLYGFRRALHKNPEVDPDLEAHIDAVRMTIEPDPSGKGVILRLSTRHPVVESLRDAVVLDH